MVTSDLGACEWFVWDLRRSGLIDRGPLDQIVGEFLKRNPRAEAPALAEYLVDQHTLTAFQAERILNGKSQGLVLGPYILLDAIGSGSMGQVYKAGSKNDNAQYAVKVLPRRSMWNVRLARRQVRSFATFNHPAVVPFMDVGTAGGLHYLAWPLVDGQTLALERGPQGGHHIWIATRMKNLRQSGSRTALSARMPSRPDVVIQPAAYVFTYDRDEGNYCKLWGLRFQLDTNAPDLGTGYKTFLGQDLEVTVEVVDSTNTSAKATRTIHIADKLLCPDGTTSCND